MKLIKFRVTKFRSIMDSTWIDCSDVTNIIGVNEAGKSNALLALWKLNPTSGGAINLLEDLPRNEYSTMKDHCENVQFINTLFQVAPNDNLMTHLLQITGRSTKELELIEIGRLYSGKYTCRFPNEIQVDDVPSKDVKDCISQAQITIGQTQPTIKLEIQYKMSVLSSLTQALATLENKSTLELDDLITIKAFFENNNIKPSTKSIIAPCIKKILSFIYEKIALLQQKPISVNDVWSAIHEELPKFVYYSNYGNLDSEIYLPHVIDNMGRTDITGAAAAKVRTLKVLFNFIGLSPKQILELGDESTNLNDTQIKAFAKKKEERTILLNSASSKLTKEFKQWWKQGNYVFDLRADGKFFKIWVSDDKRPEKVVLESRSTGLQWFLSFYLIFLTETRANLKNTIILLDEAGLSLHPLAQKDLLVFFKNLAKTNQIIHTTHSPFLVDTENVDSVILCYVDNDGYTVLSNNLRANLNPHQKSSIYAVHAALGLTVSDVLLAGCLPVIVEGPSDQYYLNAIKIQLISSGNIHPSKEIVFIPSGGVKGVSSIASIISANNELPYVVLDSDHSGNDFKNKLSKELYKDVTEKIISIKDITGMDDTEIEDLIPFSCLQKSIDKIFRDVDDDEFEETYSTNKPLLLQIENFAKSHAIALPKGYKVDLAKAAKPKIISLPAGHDKEDMWIKLFQQIK